MNDEEDQVDSYVRVIVYILDMFTICYPGPTNQARSLISIVVRPSTYPPHVELVAHLAEIGCMPWAPIIACTRSRTSRGKPAFRTSPIGTLSARSCSAMLTAVIS